LQYYGEGKENSISNFLPYIVLAVYEVGGGIKGLCEAKTAAANLPE